MTTLTEATQAIYKELVDNYVSTDLYFENEKYKTLSDFIRVSIRTYDFDQETLGAVGQRKFQRRGDISIQIFTERNKGVQDANVIKEELISILEGKSGLGGTNVYTGPMRSSFVGQDGRFRQENINIEFTFFETR